MAGSKDAFVILPFEDEFEELYEDKIAPTLENQGYSVNKADSVNSQRAILEDIINGISNADLIVADLTGKNPNVFYELGIAHGLGIPTVLISQDISELPFDLSAYKTIEYSFLYRDIEEFVAELSDIGENHSTGSIEFGNPVSDFGEIKITHNTSQSDDGKEDSKTSGNGTREVVEEDDKPEKGVLEYASEVDDEISELENIFEEIQSKSASLESELFDYTQEVQELSGMEGRRSRKRANTVAREIADSLSNFSDSIDERVEPIDEKFNFLMDTIQAFIQFSNVSEDEHRHALRQLHRDLGQFTIEMEATTKEIDRTQSDMSIFRGLNRELDKSVNNLNSSLSDMNSILREGIAKAQRFNSLIENDLGDYDEA